MWPGLAPDCFERCRNASSRLLILSYAGPNNQPQVADAKRLTWRFPCKFAHMNPSFPGCDKVRESDHKEPDRCP